MRIPPGVDFLPRDPDVEDFLSFTPEPRGSANVPRMPDVPYQYRQSSSMAARMHVFAALDRYEREHCADAKPRDVPAWRRPPDCEVCGVEACPLLTLPSPKESPVTLDARAERHRTRQPSQDYPRWFVEDVERLTNRLRGLSVDERDIKVLLDYLHGVARVGAGRSSGIGRLSRPAKVPDDLLLGLVSRARNMCGDWLRVQPSGLPSLGGRR